MARKHACVSAPCAELLHGQDQLGSCWVHFAPLQRRKYAGHLSVCAATILFKRCCDASEGKTAWIGPSIPLGHLVNDQSPPAASMHQVTILHSTTSARFTFTSVYLLARLRAVSLPVLPAFVKPAAVHQLCKCNLVFVHPD
jgi:hypothetical protein